jgi:hypothetical protein
VLVYDAEGVSACAAVLLYVAIRHKATMEQVLKWAFDLGIDLKANASLRTALESALSSSQAPVSAITSVVDKPAPRHHALPPADTAVAAKS